MEVQQDSGSDVYMRSIYTINYALFMKLYRKIPDRYSGNAGYIADQEHYTVITTVNRNPGSGNYCDRRKHFDIQSCRYQNSLCNKANDHGKE